MRPHIHWLQHLSGGKQSGFRRFSGYEIHRQPVFPFCSIPSADIRLLKDAPARQARRPHQGIGRSA